MLPPPALSFWRFGVSQSGFSALTYARRGGPTEHALRSLETRESRVRSLARACVVTGSNARPARCAGPRGGGDGAQHVAVKGLRGIAMKYPLI
eukprot:2833209-Prymnesium_polylepis.3